MQFRKLSLSAQYWFNRSWQTCIQCSFCYYVSISGTHLVQTLQYSNIAVIVSKTLKLMLSSIHSSLFIILWFMLHIWKSAWLSWTWLVFHVAVATAETHHPSSHCADIHCLITVNIQQALMNVSWFLFFFFCMEEFSDTPLHLMHFQVRCHSIRLPLCYHLSYSNNT